MLQNLFELPVYAIVALMAALVAATAVGSRKPGVLAGVFIAAAVLAGGFAYSQEWGRQLVPIRGYGMMILIGFLLGVWIAARRAHLIGCEKRHVMDVAIYGVIIGLAGARLFHVIMHWHSYNPFTAAGFDFSRVIDMFAIWNGGLVFYGTFLTVIPWAWAYCRINKLPAIAFLDLAAPSLIIGLAVGRIGCFLNGCCYGNLCELPWGVEFPAGAPAWQWQVNDHLIDKTAAHARAVHPTQIYASIAAALTSAFLYAYWPRRKFNGQIISLMLIMAGTTRFFEEMLRTDEPAAFPDISASLTIAQWIAFGIVAAGFAMLAWFSRAPVVGQTFLSARR